MEWYNSNAVLIFYCQCKKKPKPFNHVFTLTKYYKIKSIDLALLIDLERNEPRKVSCSRTETRTCNGSPVCFQEDISSWLTDTHRLLTTTGNLLQIKPWHHHTTTLTAIQLRWHLLFLGRAVPSTVLCHSLYGNQGWVQLGTQLGSHEVTQWNSRLCTTNNPGDGDVLEAVSNSLLWTIWTKCHYWTI